MKRFLIQRQDECLNPTEKRQEKGKERKRKERKKKKTRN